MADYIARRLLYMLIMIWLTTLVAFAIITLPPGDFLTSYVAQLRQQGEQVSGAEIEALRQAYGLGEPIYVQYYKWMSGIILRQDFGRSFGYNAPVTQLVAERMGPTLLIGVGSTIVVYVLAIPLGIYSAVRQYSIGDYAFTVFGFFGLSVPNFMLALILMLFFYNTFGVSIGGLFSPEYEVAPWSVGRVTNMLTHLPVPLIVIGTAGAAAVMRVMRATLLDELNQPYVDTARAKGLSEWRAILRYPTRVALNPILSTVGWVLPLMLSGEAITSIVLGLPTLGPLLLRSLMDQDMFLAATIIMFLTVLTIVGMFISDMLLMWTDPRIRLERGS